MHQCLKEDNGGDHLCTRDTLNTFGSFVTFGSFKSMRAWKHSQHKKLFSLLILHFTRSNIDILVRMNWHNNQPSRITNNTIIKSNYEFFYLPVQLHLALLDLLGGQEGQKQFDKRSTPHPSHLTIQRHTGDMNRQCDLVSLIITLYIVLCVVK